MVEQVSRLQLVANPLVAIVAEEPWYFEGKEVRRQEVRIVFGEVLSFRRIRLNELNNRSVFSLYHRRISILEK